MIAKITRKQNR